MNLLISPTLPSYPHLLDVLGRPSPREVARYTGVTPRTVERWNAAEVAPKSAMVAMFWLSCYGRSQLECDLVNELRVSQFLTNSLRDDLQQMRVRVAWLEKNGRFDSSNQPFFAPVPGPKALTVVPSTGYRSR